MDNAEYFGKVIRVEKSRKKRKLLDRPVWDFEDYHKKYYKTAENEEGADQDGKD